MHPYKKMISMICIYENGVFIAINIKGKIKPNEMFPKSYYNIIKTLSF